MRLITAAAALCALTSAHGGRFHGKGGKSGEECFAWTELGLEQISFDLWMAISEDAFPLPGDRFTEQHYLSWREYVDSDTHLRGLAEMGFLLPCGEDIAAASVFLENENEEDDGNWDNDDTDYDYRDGKDEDDYGDDEGGDYGYDGSENDDNYDY